MKEIFYKKFSLMTHRKNWQKRRPNICQFELTFGCGLHCQHCYSSCYNNPRYIKKELDTKDIKAILDKIYKEGILWLCFTGGDPLSRKDFLEIYSYAKDKGFIITIFTNAYSMNKRIAEHLRDKPPFVIEITLNAVTEDLYEKISGIKGSFAKAMEGIKLILKAKLPLKIKTQITRDNLQELPKIKKFVKGLGLRFRPSVFLYARLDGDLAPCDLRIPPQEALNLNGNRKSVIDDCQLLSSSKLQAPSSKLRLFRCAISGGDGINIDPYGNIVPCNCIRKPRVNLLEEDIKEAHKKILTWVKTRHFVTNSKCRRCSIRELCYSCPGKTWLEKGTLCGEIEWFCDLAHLMQKLKTKNSKLITYN